MKSRLLFFAFWAGLNWFLYGDVIETEWPQFPENVTVRRRVSERLPSFPFVDSTLIDEDDGFNRQFCELYCTSDYDSLSCVEGTLINGEFLVPASVKSIHGRGMILQNSKFCDKFVEINGKSVLIPKGLQLTEFWNNRESSEDSPESMYILADEQFIPQYQIIEGKLYKLSKHQKYFKRSFWSHQKKYVWKIVTNPDGTQSLWGLDDRFEGKWDAVTHVQSGKQEGNVAFIAANENGYLVYESKHGKTVLKGQIPKDEQIFRIVFPRTDDSLLYIETWKESTSSFRTWVFDGDRQRCCLQSDFLCSETDYAFIEENAEGSCLLWNNGNRTPIPSEANVLRIFSEKEPVLLKYRNKDTRMFSVYLGDEKLLEGEAVVSFFPSPDSPFRYVISAIKSRESGGCDSLLIREGTPPITYPNALLSAYSDDWRRWILSVSEDPTGENCFLLLNSGEKYGPFLNVSNVVFSSDGQSWCAIVQMLTDRRYSILYNGKLGTMYDNIIQLDIFFPHDRFHTYGLRDGKWYRIDVHFDKDDSSANGVSAQ
ncbi:MAG: hypothetical protein Q4A17_08265 [Thermoguttaceae bacterium]|nr:hypothetical protein [Thermoguttaceae bacterium]